MQIIPLVFVVFRALIRELLLCLPRSARRYIGEYAKAWGVMAATFDGDAEALFRAINSSSYISIVDSMHLPYLKHAVEHSVADILAAGEGCHVVLSSCISLPVEPARAARIAVFTRGVVGLLNGSACVCSQLWKPCRTTAISRTQRMLPPLPPRRFGLA